MPMKFYRVQARYLGVYLDHKLEAENDETVIRNFINELNAGKVKIVEDDFKPIPTKCLVYYEEIESAKNTSTAHSQKDGA